MKNDYREDGSQSWAGWKDDQAEPGSNNFVTLRINIDTSAVCAALHEFIMKLEELAEKYDFDITPEQTAHMSEAIADSLTVEPNGEGGLKVEFVPLDYDALYGEFFKEALQPWQRQILERMERHEDGRVVVTSNPTPPSYMLDVFEDAFMRKRFIEGDGKTNEPVGFLMSQEEAAAIAQRSLQAAYAEPIKKGDWVRLKSGGPVMTAKLVQPDTVNEANVLCTWPDENGMRNASIFAIECLEKVMEVSDYVGDENGPKEL